MSTTRMLMAPSCSRWFVGLSEGSHDLRWIQIRVADIDPALRQTFERHGVGTMQALLASHDRVFEHEGYGIDAKSVRDSLLA